MKRTTDPAQMLRIWTRISLLTQLGLSVVTPPILLILGALWLQRRFGAGDWVILCAILLGVFSGVCSVFSFVRREAVREARLAGESVGDSASALSEKEGKKDTDETAGA